MCLSPPSPTVAERVCSTEETPRHTERDRHLISVDKQIE